MKNNKQAFRTYLMAKGYIQYPYFKEPTFCYDTGRGVVSMIKGHDVNLKDFTKVERRGENTWVYLSKKDYNNRDITNGSFITEYYDYTNKC